MNLGRFMFGAMYRLGLTPWDGHEPLPRLTELVEGATALTPGKAIDVGCGTGDASTYLAKLGWTVTGVDFVDKALQRARARAKAAGVQVNWVRSDATRLREAGVGDGFKLILDYGMLHGLSDADRDAYVREITAIAASDATMLLIAFPVAGRRGPPRGIERDEIERRFASWRIASSAPAPQLGRDGVPLHWFELHRSS